MTVDERKRLRQASRFVYRLIRMKPKPDWITTAALRAAKHYDKLLQTPWTCYEEIGLGYYKPEALQRLSLRSSRVV